MRTKKGFKVGSGETRSGAHLTMKGVTANTLDIKVAASDTGGACAMFEQIGQTPNGGPPLHLHPFQDEWFYIIEGEYLFQVGADKHQMERGDTIFLPRNVAHAFIQLTEKGRMIVVYSPAGKMEEFFQVTNNWTSLPSREEIAAVFAEHDMKVVGPPLTIE